MDAKELAVLFHETYERLAPGFGYKTRKETREFSEHTSNGQLMIAVCGEILRHLSSNKPNRNKPRNPGGYYAV